MPQTGGLDEQHWTFVQGEQLGVSVADPVGHRIGPANALRTGVGQNWYPVDVFKHVLVGTIDGYQFFDGVGDEADWNIFIDPSPAFSFIRNDALTNTDPDELHRSSTGEILVEAEVTPDENFFNNPFFPRSGPSPLVGRDIGVYGPWVQEEAHGMRPEIHPSEALWWRDVRQEGSATLSTYHLLVVQDDSNRFDRPGNFASEIVRPWAKPPITTEFRIAVNLPVSGRSVVGGGGRRFVVEELFGRNVASVAPPNAPPIQQLKINAPVSGFADVSVEKKLGDLTHVDVAFENFTGSGRLTTQKVRGFIKLRVSVGVDDRGKEGYVVLKVTEVAEQAPRAVDPSRTWIAGSDPSRPGIENLHRASGISAPILAHPTV